MFKLAAAKKFRFASKVGSLMVEDLFDLPLKSTKGACLNDIAVELHKQLKESEEVSFVDDLPERDNDIAIMLEIVKEIISDKKAQADARKRAAENKEKKEKLLAILAEKDDQALRSLSRDDVIKLINDLSDK